MDDAAGANASVLENLKLTYTESSGFSGNGSLTGSDGKPHPVTVQISRNERGEYDWIVRDPNAKPGFDRVLSFALIKRVN